MNIVPINQQHTQPWTFRAKTLVQSASTMTLLVGGALSSAALLYYQPQQWLLTTTSVSILSLYTIPKILRHGNTWMVKTAITASLIALGSAALGGSFIASLTMGRALITSCQINSLTATLFSSFFFTGITGYAIPHSYGILQKAYSMMNHSYWHARFDYLTQHFNNLPQMGLGFLQTNILPYIYFYAALIAPKQTQSLLQFLNIESDPHLQAVITSSLSPGPNQLNLIIRFFGHLPPAQQPGEERAEAVAIALDRLKHILDYLTPEELDAEIDLLLEQSNQIVANQLSEEEFLSLFQGPALRVMNAKIDDFLNKMPHLTAQQERYNQLIAESERLRIAIEEHRVVNEETHSQHLFELDQRYIQFRSEIEHLHRQKQNWKSFIHILRGIDRRLIDHFARIEELEQLLQNRAITESFDSLHLSLYGFNPQEELSLIERLQRLTNLLNENAISKAWSFLGSDHCGFEAGDYDELCQWLRIHSFNDIEAKMVEIGLSTEEDLYANNILARQPTITPKDQIKNNLQHYISGRLESQGTFRNRVYRALTQVGQIQVNVVSQKISQAIYRATTMGLILVPVFMYPIASGIGFGCGLVYCALKRFRRNAGPPVETLLGNALLRARNAQIAINFATERNFFSLSPQSRENMVAFTKSDLFGRVRIINFEILATIAVTYLPDIICHDVSPNLGLGGFIQGAVLAKEVVTLF